jgi:hypothetical protein
MPEELLTISQAAEEFSISRHTLASRVQRGDIESFTMPKTITAPKGCRLLVRRADVAALLQRIHRRPSRQKKTDSGEAAL